MIEWSHVTESRTTQGLCPIARGAKPRRARALVVLLVPIAGLYLLAEREHRRYAGFYPDAAFRTFMVMVLPTALTVLGQWLILRIAVRPGEGAAPAGELRGTSVSIPLSKE